MKRLVLLPVVVLFLCLSCGDDDGEPSPGGPSGSPPQIAIQECLPDSATAQGPGSILMDCSLFFRDQDGDLEKIVFSYIQGCGQNPGPLKIVVSDQAGVLQEGPISLNNLIVQTTCPAGEYTYGFTAVDREGSESPVETLIFELL